MGGLSRIKGKSKFAWSKKLNFENGFQRQHCKERNETF